MQTSRRNKVNNTVTFTPKLEFRRGDLAIATGGGYSRSRTAYEQLTECYFQGVTTRLTRISWAGERSSTRSGDWHMTQRSGLPWTDPNSYNRTDPFTNNMVANPQAGQNQVWVGYLDAKKTIHVFGLPIQLGTGWKTKQSVYDVEKNGNLQ